MTEFRRLSNPRKKNNDSEFIEPLENMIDKKASKDEHIKDKTTFWDKTSVMILVVNFL